MANSFGRLGINGIVKRPIVAFLLCVVLLPFNVGAANFPRPPVLEGQIQFWTKIFGEYSVDETVIHDSLYPGIILKVVDSRPDKRRGLSKAQYYKKRRENDRQGKARVKHMLERIHQAGGDTSGLSREEKRIRGLYANFRGNSKYREAAHRIRGQGGLKERMAKAIVISGRYLPYMEEVFRQEGMPVKLTRLPFVESSFNVKAYSRVAAAGIWQFMPSSGRIYNLRNNEVVDDRRDPWLATRAAANHLKDDYKLLKDWGLAVTAYNHGRQGVKRALKKVGGNGIEDLVERYKGKRFGFASRNFYTSFLGAVDVERNYRKYFGELKREPPLKFDIVRPRHYVAFSTLAKLSGLSVEKFAELNPAFHPHVQEGKMRVPPQYTIRVPVGRKSRFEQQYAALGNKGLFKSQRQYYVNHRVRKGENLGSIARKYGSSSRLIQKANGLRSANRISIGQVLKIPPKNGGSASMSAPRESKKKLVSSSYSGASRTHKVRKGDTLSSIARKYDTSVNAIKRINGISNVRGLQIGQVLKVKGKASGGFVSHRVRSGQTLSSIAKRYGSSVRAIQNANGMRNSSRIKIGQVLRVPRG